MMRLLALLAFTAVPLTAQQGTIQGTVRPATEATAIEATVGLASVQVEALAADGRRVGGMLTNQQGAYRLSVPAGTYTVVFSLPGWGTHEEAGVQVTAGEVTALNVSLRPQAFDLNPITVTASRRVEKALDAPADVQV